MNAWNSLDKPIANRTNAYIRKESDMANIAQLEYLRAIEKTTREGRKIDYWKAMLERIHARRDYSKQKR